MKVQVCRHSGYPINEEDGDLYRAEFKAGYDKLYDLYGKDMLTLRDELSIFDKEIALKYKTTDEWEFISSEEEFKSKIEKYGSILVSTHKDTGELIYVIMDMGL